MIILYLCSRFIGFIFSIPFSSFTLVEGEIRYRNECATGINGDNKSTDAKNLVNLKGIKELHRWKV
jgi:hypothetical protein